MFCSVPRVVRTLRPSEAGIGEQSKAPVNAAFFAACAREGIGKIRRPAPKVPQPAAVECSGGSGFDPALRGEGATAGQNIGDEL
ncbi:hypothetical protein SCH01S_48_01910 [Sphingomonas changbaiensis NBRC 104936]|uniref:Uncharacterized protein n=1 Tax=Sphingomonas changbaiensis NBRC 104936 TaxID=1219043 RepID=A0A0E9MSI3_9SPHN|nr:hypothetical protein SCH01S_48_01910 [Sphingomonas changbaiensis NBRC 104936]